MQFRRDDMVVVKIVTAVNGFVRICRSDCKAMPAPTCFLKSSQLAIHAAAIRAPSNAVERDEAPREDWREIRVSQKKVDDT